MSASVSQTPLVTVLMNAGFPGANADSSMDHFPESALEVTTYKIGQECKVSLRMSLTFSLPWED